MTYSDDQWVADFEASLDLQRRGFGPAAMQAEMSRLFLAKYQDEYAERFVRFGKAMICLSQHDKEFDYGDTAVVGEQLSMISDHLLLGLKDYFCSLPSRDLENEPDFEKIKKATEGRRLRKSDAAGENTSQ